jgi:transglutaminase-like putative cysteine protease
VVAGLCASPLAPPVASGAYSPVLHERIPSDPRDDVALSVSLDGDLPAAIDTPSGLVTAPDPRRPPASSPRPDGAASDLPLAPPNATFRPDLDTRRPDVLPYEDPFTPSTAPFKRLIAFDTVDASYTLSVRDPRMQPLSTHGQVAGDGSDERFYGDLVVDLVPGKRTRIPSVGPGAKVIRARAGVGTADVPFRLLHDGADNWFIEADTTTRARLVMEIAIARAAFGGEVADPGWSDLPKVPSLPSNVVRAANEVATRIGVSRALSPREAVTKLVGYYRTFADSDDPPAASGDVFLDLALSRKGVCRHRAFAFLVSALALGIPTRMITNEAHAWVEVHDGSMWRRIDLGGAGRALRDPLASPVRHEAPQDPFGWPPNATRGEDLAERARAAASSPSGGGAGGGGGGGGGASTSGGPSAGSGGTLTAGDSEGDDATGGGAAGGGGASVEKDERPASTVTVELLDADAHRGGPMHVRGQVTADGDACGHVVVEIMLQGGGGGIEGASRASGASARRGAARAARVIGTLATDTRGAYEGALVVPQSVPLGDYDIVARTPGDARCGRGGVR